MRFNEGTNILNDNEMTKRNKSCSNQINLITILKLQKKLILRNVNDIFFSQTSYDDSFRKEPR